MSIDISRDTEKRSDRTLMCNGGWGALRGTGPRTTGTEARFFCLKQDGQDAQDGQDEGFLRSIQICTGHD